MLLIHPRSLFCKHVFDSCNLFCLHLTQTWSPSFNPDTHDPHYRFYPLVFLKQQSTICIENRKILGRIQMERFIPVEIFRKKVIPSEVLPFSRSYRNDQNFLYHLSGLPVPGFMMRESEKFTVILLMVQLNPVPVFGAQNNTSTIWQKFFTEIAVQMVSAPGFFPFRRW